MRNNNYEVNLLRTNNMMWNCGHLSAWIESVFPSRARGACTVNFVVIIVIIVLQCRIKMQSLPPSLPLSLSLSLSLYFQAERGTCARATHAMSARDTHAPTQPPARTRARSHARMRARKHARTRTRAHTHAHRRNSKRVLKSPQLWLLFSWLLFSC